MKKEDIDERTLTPKEERFCYEYVMYLNATKAAINAQYKEKTAKQMASRLLKRDDIQERIKYLKNNLAEISGISALRILKEHEKIAFSDTKKLCNGWMTLEKFESLTPEQKATIQEITIRETKYGKEVKIKTYNKQKSLDCINAMLGYKITNNIRIVEKEAKSPFADMTDEELDAQIAELEKNLNFGKPNKPS
ncbi:hypothetical protein EZS27_011575 [termite gut metagenome]|uniref:Terminase small subunit n=1 Tax=termite gut metagenome TaxID=433724 RepID=A0A5J4S3F8_9ZZZZ